MSALKDAFRYIFERLREGFKKNEKGVITDPREFLVWLGE